MNPQRRHPPVSRSFKRREREHPVDGQVMRLDEFWDFLADETEAMSEEELRAELVPLNGQWARKDH